jgi:methylmalonyl-CoA mutase
MTSIQPLAGGFPRFSEDDWHAAAARSRRAGAGGAATDPGPGKANPLYPRSEGARAIVGRAPGKPWRIVERVDSGDAEAATRIAVEATAGGATGLDLVLPLSLHPLTRRIEIEPAALAALLAGAVPEGTEVRVDAGAPTTASLGPYLDIATTRKCDLVWSADPVAAYAIRGLAVEGSEAAIRSARSAFVERGVDGAVVVADGRLWHAGGANEEQMLGVALASYVHYVRLLGSPDRIGIALACDADQFRTIAAFRAMRLLVARVVEVADLPAPRLRIHAETAWRSLSGRDPETNILRATAATFAAAAGGADSIAVLPFDTVARNGGSARRLARHTQTILAEEAHLGRVADPGAGSDAIEALTAMLAEAAWRRFQSIEAEGGIVPAIAEGALLREIAESREARLARVARGDISLIGVNAFRGEAATATIKRTPVKRTGPLTFKRLSEPFEAP